MQTSFMRSHNYKLFSIVVIHIDIIIGATVCYRNTMHIQTGRLCQNISDYHIKKIILKYVGQEKRKKHPKVLCTKNRKL